MPNTASAKKRLRQNDKRNLHNRSMKSSIRTSIRKVREAAAAGEIEKAEAEFHLTTRKLDKAGARRVIHPNTASRLKSRLSACIKSAKQG